MPLRRFAPFEKYLLSQAVPSLNLPALTPDHSVVDLYERAAIWGIGEIGTDVLALAKILGVVPSSYRERLALTLS
jgi:hypothetical protein